MIKKISKTQKARLLGSFILHSHGKGEIVDQEKFFAEIGQLFSNGNVLVQQLFELNNERIVDYDEIGEDGFAPIIMVGCTERTHEHLATLLQEIDEDMEDLRRRLAEILTFDPERLKNEISGAEAQIKSARRLAEESPLLKPLLPQISSIEKHFHGVAAVADKYEDVYKNIIRPVQLEGQSGVKATVQWAIISIFVSTLISVFLGNWKDILEIFRKLH
ncbi:hypothetical protein [Janthinobacterium sp. PSPC2-1]|uniref:hypothetical protein n=1 Tax=unclassified Janthinobacterium TaxID=2610881 RepID=UPI003CF46A23